MRGIERRDLPLSIDVELAIDLLIAPLSYRRLISHGPISQQLPAELVDWLLASTSIGSKR